MILGIDPGKSGGVALVDGMQFVEGHRMPLLSEGKRDLVDTRQLTRDWSSYMDHRLQAIVIEKVHAMPKQGVSSSFNFGRHTGAVEGWALQWGLPIMWVSPASWKKRMGLSSDKRASLDAARLYFGEDKRWEVLAEDGVAEAALMALDWHRQFGKQH